MKLKEVQEQIRTLEVKILLSEQAGTNTSSLQDTLTHLETEERRIQNWVEAKRLYEAGELTEAIHSLQAELACCLRLVAEATQKKVKQRWEARFFQSNDKLRLFLTCLKKFNQTEHRVQRLINPMETIDE